MNKRLSFYLSASALCCALLFTACAPEASLVEVSSPQITDSDTEAPQYAAAAVEVGNAQLANILDFTGSVTVTSEGQSLGAYPGMRLLPGDTTATGALSEAQIEMDQDRLIILEQNSQISIQQDDADSICVLLNNGSIINDIAPGGIGSYNVRAGNITMGVLGTVFRVSTVDADIIIDLFEGKLTIIPNDGAQAGNSVTLQSGERVVVDGDSIGTPEPVSFEGLPPERLDWLRNKLAERNATDVLAALDGYLKALESPAPSAKHSPAPAITPKATPVATPELIHETTPWNPPIVIPTIGGAARVDRTAPSNYHADGTDESWDAALVFHSAPNTVYRAYIRHENVWRLASGAAAVTAGGTSTTITAYGVQNNDRVAVVPITSATDSTEVPAVALTLMMEYGSKDHILLATDRSSDVHIASATTATPSSFAYTLKLFDRTSELPISEFNYHAVGYPDSVFSRSGGEDMTLKSISSLSFFDPIPANACLLNENELYLYGRRGLSNES